MRTPLPNRRDGYIETVRYEGARGTQKFIVTYGFDAENHIREIFCTSPKAGSDLQGLISDAAITASILLQHGMTVAIADALGESGRRARSLDRQHRRLARLRERAQHWN